MRGGRTPLFLKLEANGAQSKAQSREKLVNAGGNG